MSNMYNKPKAIVFGAGAPYKYHYKYIHHYFDVIALVDNNLSKQGIMFEGNIVESPKEINKYKYDCIIIPMPDERALEIRKQLEQMGIPVSKMRFNDGGLEPYKINSIFFADNLKEFEKRKLFSENVERVIIEINSKCNRKCWFCTNSILEVCSNDMPENVLDRIISELSEIEYSQEICLSFFNEPLLCTKLIEYVQRIKKALPNTFLYLATNGDYLSEEIVCSLKDAGLDLLMIDIYTDEFIYNIDEAYLRAIAIKEKCNLCVELEKREFQMGYGKYENMDIEFYSQDFSKRASNRAESLPENLPIPKITSHPSPCIKSFISFHIDFRGDVWPCPNYHREYAQHRQYCLGNVLEESIYEIYLGKRLNEYREKNLFHRDTLPCRSCIWDFKSFISNRFHHSFRDRPSLK